MADLVEARQGVQNNSSQWGKSCSRPLRRFFERLETPAHGDLGGGERGLCACVAVSLRHVFSGLGKIRQSKSTLRVRGDFPYPTPTSPM